MKDLLAEPTPTRNEIRALLADPASTQKQGIEAKRILGRRIANGADSVRQICEHYHLTPEQTEKMVSSHQCTMSEAEAIAAEAMQRLERALEDIAERH